MSYVPTPGPLEGERYEPSNGTEGAYFIEEWCTNCARDKVLNGEATQDEADADPSLYCEILNASYRGEAVEWREMSDGEVKCIAFVQQGKRIPERCPNTLELPL